MNDHSRPRRNETTVTAPHRRERSEELSRSSVDIVVSVGTDHHRFDRLIGWVDEWCDEHPEATVVIQRGASKQSRHGRCRELFPHDELCDMFAQATAVVSHGGPSTVMDARGAGRFPIVVARDPERGEHVDQHQLRFAEHLARHHVAEVVATKEGLFEAIDRALANPADFAVAVGRGASDGVLRFASVIDDLLFGGPSWNTSPALMTRASQ